MQFQKQEEKAIKIRVCSVVREQIIRESYLTVRLKYTSFDRNVCAVLEFPLQITSVSTCFLQKTLLKQL